MTSPNVYHVFIDYTVDDDNNTWSYQGVRIAKSGDSGGTARVINSGDPIRDWLTYLEEARKVRYTFELAGENVAIMETSSITHFLMDVPGYRMVEQDGVEIMVEEDRPERDEHIQHYQRIT